MAKKQTTSFTKKKVNPPAGFRTSKFFKGSSFSGGGASSKHAAGPSVKFHTQHKGGS